MATVSSSGADRAWRTCPAARFVTPAAEAHSAGLAIAAFGLDGR